jgi:hypothetical protein
LYVDTLTAARGLFAEPGIVTGMLRRPDRT